MKSNLNKSRFSFNIPEESPGFLLWQVTNLWQKQIIVRLKLRRLTHVQFVVLATAHWLSMSSKQVSQSQIAAQTKIDQMVISNTIKALEKKGLVRRFPHQGDTRAKNVEITSVGTKALAAALTEVEDIDRKFFKILNKGIRTLNSQLVALIQQNSSP